MGGPLAIPAQVCCGCRKSPPPVAPSAGRLRHPSPAFVTASRGCQEELLHRFLKCFAVARTARCSASRASGKSRRQRLEPRRAERSQSVPSPRRTATALGAPAPRRPVPAAELPRRPPPRAPGSMPAAGCALLAALLAAPAVAMALGSCRALGKETWRGQGDVTLARSVGECVSPRAPGARPGLTHLC